MSQRLDSGQGVCALSDSGIGITSAIYVHVSDSLAQQAVDQFETVMARPVPEKAEK